MSGWVVRKRISELREGDRFIFSDALGGEGEVLTVQYVSTVYGVTDVQTEELDFEIGSTEKTLVTMAPEEEEE